MVYVMSITYTRAWRTIDGAKARCRGPSGIWEASREDCVALALSFEPHWPFAGRSLTRTCSSPGVAQEALAHSVRGRPSRAPHQIDFITFISGLLQFSETACSASACGSRYLFHSGDNLAEFQSNSSSCE